MSSPDIAIVILASVLVPAGIVCMYDLVCYRKIHDVIKRNNSYFEFLTSRDHKIALRWFGAIYVWHTKYKKLADSPDKSD